jgi:lysophospholipase L1-like esterase
MVWTTGIPQLFFVLFSCDIILSSANKLLMLGDSWAEFAQSYPTNFCPGLAVVNNGVASSLASEWATNSACPPPENDRQCSAPASFGATSDITHVWLSIGGNDFIDTGCPSDANSLLRIKNDIRAAIDQVRTAGGSGVQILLSGYATPTGPLANGNCGVMISAIKNLNDQVHLATSGLANVSFIGIADTCGATATTYSDAQYFQDTIHLNMRGYCEVFTDARVQSALGCVPASYDCATVPQTGCKLVCLDWFTVVTKCCCLCDAHPKTVSF